MSRTCFDFSSVSPFLVDFWILDVLPVLLEVQEEFPRSPLSLLENS